MKNDPDPDPLSARKVSIIIAVCHRDEPAYVREAVSSALAQTHANLEVLAAADGPLPEATQGYLETTAREDNRLRVMPLAGGLGPARVRNAAIACATGDYIAVLDADDVAAPDRIARQIAFLEETGADVAGCWYRLIDDAGCIIGRKETPLTPHAIRRALCWFNPIANSSVCARAEALRQHPYREPFLKGPACFGEDYDLWVTLALHGFVLRNQEAELLDFRVGSGFLTRRRGWGAFRTDLRIKFRAVRLYPPITRAVAALAAICTASFRLCPLFLLRIAYALRNGLRFSSARSR
ncbi:MAG TPA: glycosyltransferase family 2 protein [Candidatus Hydrogenedentes bacterium]|nr:glycosyltransferase family 2 protein [Candidatus Hydrogenedentota bacterium]HOS03366.1 glycosyltransferase family 2 protein [Candidatus Hydrogenedentota bacterium]